MLRHINPRRILCAKVRVNSALFSSRTVTGYHDFHVKSRTFMCFFKPFSMTVSCPVTFPVLPEFRILFPVKIRTELLLSGKQQNGTFLSAGTGGINCPAFLINKKRTLSDRNPVIISSPCLFRYDNLPLSVLQFLFYTGAIVLKSNDLNLT